MDAVNPLELLTRDGWYHVISRVKIPEDVFALASSHSLFHSVIKTEREEDWMSTLFYMAFPYFSDYLDKSDVLNLRLVKWIKPIIDEYLKQNKIHAFSSCPVNIDLHEHLGSINGMKTLLENMRTLPIAKILKFDVGHSYFQKTNLDCYNFLREFGEQVIHLGISFDYYYDFGLETKEALRFLKNILDCVPNLSSLGLSFECIIRRVPLPFHTWAQDVKQLWSHNPLPNLPKLETFYISILHCEHNHHDPCLATPVIRSLLKAYANQITYLDMNETPNSVQMLPTMSALKTLRVALYTLDDVASLQNLQAPITKICVILRNILQPIQSKQIFRAVERFKDTLMVLDISTNNWKLGRMRKLPLNVNLPLLRHLILYGNFNGSIGLNIRFLETFGKLQTLDLVLINPGSWKYDSSDDDSTGSTETCLLSDSVEPDENMLYKSSIWEQLPDLKSVNENIYAWGLRSFHPTFTRNSYEIFKISKSAKM